MMSLSELLGMGAHDTPGFHRVSAEQAMTDKRVAQRIARKKKEKAESDRRKKESLRKIKEINKAAKLQAKQAAKQARKSK